MREKPSIGMTIANRYRLVDILGSGKFTEVWHAIDVITDVPAAIKIFVEGLDGELNLQDSIKKKFVMLYGINHSNILHPTHFGIHDKWTYLLMQYCKHGNVAKKIYQREHIHEIQCWQILHDVAAGLACLHSQPHAILHLDIKPENILIHDDGHYMITDFDISDYYNETVSLPPSGTLSYMAPERFERGNAPVKANDIWALGAMMYEILTMGDMPFGKMGGSIQTESDQTPILMTSHSSDLKEIIYQCLSYHPWQRPVAKDIEEYAYKRLLEY